MQHTARIPQHYGRFKNRRLLFSLKEREKLKQNAEHNYLCIPAFCGFVTQRWLIICSVVNFKTFHSSVTSPLLMTERAKSGSLGSQTKDFMCTCERVWGISRCFFRLMGAHSCKTKGGRNSACFCHIRFVLLSATRFYPSHCSHCKPQIKGVPYEQT